MESWRLRQGEVDRLLAARHDDPFAVLGPHAVEGGVVVRALLPGAARLALADGRELARRQGPLFEDFLPDARLPLDRRRWAEGEGGAWEFDDPYAFGPSLGPLDDHLLVEGTHTRLYERLGAHVIRHQGALGVRFAVWAPNAKRVAVVGAHNGWDGRVHPMRRRLDSGLWELFIPGLDRKSVV